MLREKCCEIRCEMSGENGGIMRKLGEGLKRHSPSVDAGPSMFLRGYGIGTIKFSRLPD